MPAAQPQRVMNFLRTYKFGETQKDPIIDRIHTIMEDTGTRAKDIEKGGGPKAGTIGNWLDGPTRRPQFASIVAAVRCMGYDVALVPTSHHVNGKAWKATMPPIVKRFRSVRG